jgi:RHS repeat-associated protein
MCPGVVVEGGGADSGGAGGGGGKGKGKKGGGGKGNGPDGSSGAKNGAPDPAKYPLCGTKSHPVDVVTGRAHTHPIEDFALGGPLPLVFTRSCSSAAASHDFGLGWGWAHTLGWLLEIRRDLIRVWTDKGTTVDFPLLPVGAEHLGPFGWVLRREPWGYALDADDDLWRIFSVSTEGKRRRAGMSPVLDWCAQEAWLLTAVDDRNKNRIALTYDQDTLRLTTVTDSAGRELRTRYDQSGRIHAFSVRNAPTHGAWVDLARYDHDREGHLLAATDPDGHSAVYAYDEASHRLTKDQDKNGLAFHFTYWPDGRCRESWGAYTHRPDPSVVDKPKFLHDGKTPSRGIHHCLFEFGDEGFSAVTDATQTSSFQGNDFGLIDEWNEGPATTKATYRDDGHLLTLTDACEATTTYERDRRGRVTKVTDPLGRTTTIHRDPYGLPLRIQDPAGGETTLQRDNRGNLLWIRDPSGALTRYQRDPRGLITQITDPNDALTQAAYDPQGNLTAVQQPDGGLWRYTYDFLGRRTSATDPLGHTTHYQYSPRGDLIAIRDPLGQTTRYAYDGEGHLATAQSPSGHFTRLEWGGYHKLVRRTDPNGNKVRLGYNVEGELTHVWNERGELHRLHYTSSGILREENTFDGRTLTYRHDPAGRPIAIRNGNKELTELTYDLAGQLTTRKLPDETEEKFTYSLLGDLVESKSPGLELKFERDPLGRIIREVQTLHGVSHVVELQHNLAGDRVGRSTSLGHREQVTRDPAGNRRLTVLDGREITHSPDLLGRDLQRRLPAGGAIESTYDPLGRLHDRRTLGPEREILPLPGQPASVAPARSNVTAFKAFRYDADGELIETIDRDRGRTKFTYDPVGQLLSMVPEKARAELFRYDKTGNLFEDGPNADTRVYSKGNRLLQKGNTQYAWDQDGRLVEKRTVEPQPGLDAPKEEVWRYSWNGAGLLQKATRHDGLIVECTYDPFARRLEKKVLHQTSKLLPPTLQARTRFVWDGDVLVHEIREAGLEKGDPVVEERTYWFEDDGFEPLAHREKRVDDVGRERGGWFHYVNDPIGTPDRLLAEDGSIATEYERKAWGQLEPKSGAKATTPIRLQGQYWDEETGLAYNRWRYYDGEGRFVSADPIGLDAGPNLFAHPASAPDPWGLAPTEKMSMGERLERKRRDELRADGWTILPSKYGSGNGPDIVATKPGPNGTTLTLLEECKAGSSKLGMTNHGPQMGDKWTRNATERLRACDSTRAAGDALEKAMDDGSLQKQLTRGKQAKKGGRWKTSTKSL